MAIVISSTRLPGSRTGSNCVSGRMLRTRGPPASARSVVPGPAVDGARPGHQVDVGLRARLRNGLARVAPERFSGTRVSPNGAHDAAPPLAPARVGG